MEKPIHTRFLEPIFLLYITKCLIGTVICYALYKALPQYHLYWSIISLLLVLAPDWNDSIALPLNRIKANITGGLVGLLCFFLPFSQMLNLCLGVVFTIIVCQFLQFPSATRSALAALVIVLIQEYEAAKWTIAAERILSVVLGCLVALGLTLLFHTIEKKMPSKTHIKEGTH